MKKIIILIGSILILLIVFSAGIAIGKTTQTSTNSEKLTTPLKKQMLISRSTYQQLSKRINQQLVAPSHFARNANLNNNEKMYIKSNAALNKRSFNFITANTILDAHPTDTIYFTNTDNSELIGVTTQYSTAVLSADKTLHDIATETSFSQQGGVVSMAYHNILITIFATGHHKLNLDRLQAAITSLTTQVNTILNSAEL